MLPEHYRLLQRNVLYTAITRAQEVCVLVGAKHALDLAVRRHQAPAQHRSGRPAQAYRVMLDADD